MKAQLEYVPNVAHRYSITGDVRLHFVEAGTGPLVVLLHGFPDFWYSWRHQIESLAAAGFRVVAPDMRGYNLSDRPNGLAAYELSRLGRDVATLIHERGAERASVVGHDWGGVVAWTFAMRFPEMLDRLVILNAPHPADLFGRMLRPRQLLRSWYVFLFQLPWLPEACLRARDFAALRRMLRASAVSPMTFTDLDLERYAAAFHREGALAAGINYYRALVRRNPIRTYRELRRVDASVRVIWGEQDVALVPELAEPPARWAPNARVDRLSDAGHWVHLDRPERVNVLLTDSLRSPDVSFR